MERFFSTQRLFSILVPNGWKREVEGNIYTFYNEQELQGVFQLSSFYSQDEDLKFVPEVELTKELLVHNTAQIIPLSKYQAIHYAIQDDGDKLLHYYWITGQDKIKIFCSLIINSEQNDAELDKAYDKVSDILNTIEIHPYGT